MVMNLRKSGIEILGNVPWGTHFCQFYHTGEELIDILVPYLKQGLEDNEYCIWITSAPLLKGKVEESLRKAIPDFDSYGAGGQVEILPSLSHSRGGGHGALSGWVEKLDEALARGYKGLRVAWNVLRVERKEWRNLTACEEEINTGIGACRMIALCAYSIERCTADEVIDVVNTHQFALTKREGRWELIESSERRRAVEERERLLLEAEEQRRLLQLRDEALQEQNRELERLWEETRRAEKALRLSEQRLTLALKAGRSGTFLWDVKKNDSVWSDEMLDLYGLRRGQFDGRLEDWIVCMVPEDREAGAAAVKDSLKTGEFCLEFRIRRRDNGEIRWMHGRGQLSYDAEGRPVRMIGINVDITGRMRVEEELRRAHDELEKRVEERTAELARTVEALRDKERMLLQQSRQAAMGEMIGNIAHQWRQPLNGLGLIIQSLPILQELGELSREYLRSVEERAMGIILHMSQTIDDFKDYFKPDKEKVPFSVNGAVSKAVSFLEDSFRNRQITVEVVTDEDPVINGYPNEYSQVLLNILLNARDAFAQQRTDDAKVIIATRSENGKAVVTITDNAGGIPSEIMGKIFDPYFTTKSTDHGTGVGLFMSKGIIEKNMGGKLTARNTGNGAEFRIEV
jgi:PAS domain S-box-containing protein